MRLQSDPGCGIPPLHHPESARSMPPAAKSDSGARGSTPTNCMAGPSREIRKHSYKHWAKTSSKSIPKIPDMPTSKPTDSAQEYVICPQSHRHNKKSMKHRASPSPHHASSVPSSPALHKIPRPSGTGEWRPYDIHHQHLWPKKKGPY